MLKIFGRDKTEHPLADIKEARRILAELPADDPPFCLEEVAHWVTSVAEERGFKPEYQAQLLELLDDSGRAYAQRIGREYLQAHRQPKQREMRLWQVLNEFWRALALAYTAVAEKAAAAGAKSMLPGMAARAFRALGAQLKWNCTRYGVPDSSLWETATRVHRAVAQPQIAQIVVSVPGTPAETTVERELARLLMFAVCSPHSLTPVDIDLCERLVGHFSARFKLAGSPSAETPYWMDLGAAAQPHRGPLPTHTLGPLCFFGAGPAYDALRIFKADMSAAGVLPSGMDLGGTYEFRQVIGVLNHLEAHWAPRLPERRHARQTAKSRLTVARGFDGVLDVLQPTASMAFSHEETESWVVQNVSTGGFGADIPQITGDWLRVGSLIAMQTEGSVQWSVGVVRRLNRVGALQASVGIQTLTRAALPVKIRIISTQLSGVDREAAVLLPALRSSDELKLILR
ncbi:MAG TPA: hypothetical protein VJM53_02980, partial [Burkholderiales bacterium]|nr:hypothetical protein [Burkholderiales bacterium]